MKKLVIVFFLFLGGVSLLGEDTKVEAADMRSHSSISFDETYIYVPEKEVEGDVPLTGISPTGMPPKLLGPASGGGNYLLPRTGETSDIWLQMVGIFVVTTCLVRKKQKTGRRNEQ